MSANLLDPAWNAYLAIGDCIRIARRTLRNGGITTHSRLDVLLISPPTPEERVSDAADKANDYVIFAMWAEFERFLIEFISSKTDCIKTGTPTGLTADIRDHVYVSIEYSRIDELLDILKTLIDPDVVGQLKQIKQYRDWLAHKNPSKGTPSKTDPKTAYALLSATIEQIRSAT
ncbi:MAG: hypothetical protein G3I10_03515 [Ferrovum sp.]|nr:hypothetical protein [Ferrovum sp.]